MDLWKTSGHWEHYKDDMFSLKEGDAAVPAAIVDGSSADDANAMATAGSTEEAAIQYALKVRLQFIQFCFMYGFFCLFIRLY